jgi:diacylglycerol O-acyltransferase / wax synthase
VTRAIDWLSSLDTSFLQLENDAQQMHVGSLLILDGPGPTYAQFLAHVESRLAAVPRYRQRVKRLAMDVARPYWADDPHFSLAYHLRHTAIPHPGDETQLRALAGRVMSQRLDLARPLWEMWLVEGLPDGRWAVISKVHHAMIDGVSGHDILETLLDRDPSAAPWPRSDWSPRPEPSRSELTAAGAEWMVAVPGRLGRLARHVVAQPDAALRDTAVRVRGLAAVGRQATRPTSVLNGPLGPHRRWAWARAGLADAKAVKDAAGGTINDVVLTAITGGFRTFLAGRGESVADDIVRSMVPVSVRSADEHGRLGNKVSAMFADLPVGIDDPMARLTAVSQQMSRLKAGGMSVGVHSMVAAADFVPPTLVSLGARVAVTVGQRVVNTVTTNIPGPQYPLYLCGRRLREMFPYIPVGQAIRISIGIVSYDGGLYFAATGDADAVPDLDDLCIAIEDSMAELVAAVAP